MQVRLSKDYSMLWYNTNSNFYPVPHVSAVGFIARRLAEFDMFSWVNFGYDKGEELHNRYDNTK
jgi:hypothetical protein